MEIYTSSWSYGLFCFLFLVGFYFLLLLFEGLVKRAHFLKEWQGRINHSIQVLLHIYEPVALVVMVVVFMSINPMLHVPIIVFFILLAFQPLRNYISGRIFVLANDLKVGQRIEVKGNTGVVQKMERLGMILQTPDGLRFVNYSSLLAEGFVLLEGKKIGGLHQIHFIPNDEKQKNHENIINIRLLSCPYIDWSYRPDITKVKKVEEGDDQYRVRVLVREDQHLHHLMRLVKEWGYDCKLADQ